LRGKGEMILFVDDEQMVVDMNRELLEELGYRVVAETDPIHALEIFRGNSSNFDIVITDKTMPQMTGFDVIREIRDIRADIPVILCSGFQTNEDMEKIIILGISQMITKPSRMNILAKAVRDALDKNRFEAQYV
jgi:CheY-like chemotaxis protein